MLTLERSGLGKGSGLMLYKVLGVKARIHLDLFLTQEHED